MESSLALKSFPNEDFFEEEVEEKKPPPTAKFVDEHERERKTFKYTS